MQCRTWSETYVVNVAVTVPSAPSFWYAGGAIVSTVAGRRAALGRYGAWTLQRFDLVHQRQFQYRMRYEPNTDVMSN